MANKNTSALAGEFLVAGELSRRGYLVSITMGNAKAIDIFASTARGEKITFDIKASSYKTSWPVSEIDDGIDFYVFISLQSPDILRSQSLNNENTPPEDYVLPGKDINEKNLITPWQSIPGIKYHALEEYRERWDKLPPP